jgi:PIN domain nuclease of toxin-antitoxin system
MVVLDTCAIIEVFKEKSTLSSKTLEIMQEQSYVLSVSFAEILCKVKLKKLTISMSPQTLFKHLLQIKTVQLVNIGLDEWFDSIELDWPDNKDPADRLITAFAMTRGLSIVTSNQKIKAFYDSVMW